MSTTHLHTQNASVGSGDERDDATREAVAKAEERARQYSDRGITYRLIAVLSYVLAAIAFLCLFICLRNHPWAAGVIGFGIIGATAVAVRVATSRWKACRAVVEEERDEAARLVGDIVLGGDEAADDDRPTNQHDDDDEDDDDEDDDEDHAIDSDIALDRFTDRAMRHGRRAATWLLIGALAEVGVLTGDCYAIAPVHSFWLIVLTTMMTSAAMFTIAGLIKIRWDRHRERMESVLQDAMVWRSDVQQKERDKADALAQHYRDRADEDQREALAAELTWNVGPAPVYIDAEGQRHPTAEQIALEKHARREFGDLFDSLDGPDEQHDDVESDDVPVVPAVRAWMQHWADMKPVRQPRPARLVKRHSDAEGRRLERELCRAINKHWTGAFHKLLDEGADPNGFNGSGKPLRIALLRGRTEYISWLLALGADPNGQCYGRTMLTILTRQIEDYIDEGAGEGDDFEWPERIEMLSRWGANPHVENQWYDEDDESEGPTAWPFILKRPVIYEAYMKGRNAWLQADRDALTLLDEARERAELEAFADEAAALLNQARGMGPA
ncbi:ankyrin repeat domain-containing protein [Burkholderia sp. LMG 13014]|uniref:ankyrin repeat domain-containing protein n=1 Tax=Burkholderia sp. LMG 13014 TaxID=2709306 RepID=UPI0019633E19|nr:ankyrin repeat domain-containing protein [Burkholderia sp. LMG 13014]